MDSDPFPTKFCQGIRSLWRSRSHRRLHPLPRRSVEVVKLGGPRPSARRRLRLAAGKQLRRLRIGVPSPSKLLGRIRDSYMDGMLRFAGTAVAEGPWAQRQALKARSVKETGEEFEMKLVGEIYKSVAASRAIHAAA